MKRLILPSIIGLALFGVLAVPKVYLGLASFDEGGWAYAKQFFSRIFIDFLFAWVVALVVWLQLNHRPWIATLAFCLSTLLVTGTWYSAVKNAPRAFRQEMAFLYDYVEAAPLRELPAIPKPVVNGKEPSAQVPRSVPVEKLDEPEPGALAAPEQLIEETFYAVLRALKKYDKETVVALSDQKTSDYFADLKELALTADREVLGKLKPIDRFQVLALRHIRDARELSSMTEKRLFEQAIIQGWFYIGDKPEVRIDFIDILPGGTEARADIIVQSIIPDERLEFVKEQGIWKMNLLRLLPRQEEKLLTALNERGQTEEEFFYNFLKQETGREPSPDIWKPLVPAPEQG